jgi:hypothetical protein
MVLPQGAWCFRKGMVADDPSSELTTLAIGLFRGLLDQLRQLKERTAASFRSVGERDC